MKVFVLLALVAIVQGCAKSGSGGGGDKGMGGDKDGEYGDKMCGGMDEYKDVDFNDEYQLKRMMEGMPPMGIPKRLWKHMMNKTKAWDKDGLIAKKGMSVKQLIEMKMYMKKKTILIGATPSAYNGIKKDLDMGGVKGFIPTLLKKTCEACDLNCKFVMVKDSERCFNPEDLTSEGLNNNHFTACAGYPRTKPANMAFGFSVPMLRTPQSQIYIRSDFNGVSSIADLNGKKVGVLSKGDMGKYCLRFKLGEALESYDMNATFTEYETKEELIKNLKDAKVDVILGPAMDELPEEMKTLMSDLKRVSEPFYCAHGRALIHRKDKDMRVFGMCYHYAVVKSKIYNKLADDYDIPQWLRVNYEKFMESGGKEM